MNEVHDLVLSSGAHLLIRIDREAGIAWRSWVGSVHNPADWKAMRIDIAEGLLRAYAVGQLTGKGVFAPDSYGFLIEDSSVTMINCKAVP